MSDTNNTSPRRKFLKNAAVGSAGAAAMGFPMISSAQTINLRFQSTWPAKDIFHEYANDYATKINAMSGGRLKIEVLPAGSVVKAFDMLDAVSSGTLDGGHGVLAYWYGKSPALALWGSGPAFGMDANTVLAWNQEKVPAKFDELAHVCRVAGGGKAFVPWLKQLKVNIGITGGLAAHGIKPDHLPRLVQIATADICHQTNPRHCTSTDFEALFKAAM